MHECIMYLVIEAQSFNRHDYQKAFKERYVAAGFMHAWMYLCIYVCMHSHSTTQLPKYKRTLIHAHMHTCMPTCSHTQVQGGARNQEDYIPTCMHAYIHTNIHTYIYTYIRSWRPELRRFHTYVHVCIHTHKHTDSRRHPKLRGLQDIDICPKQCSR